MGMKRGTEKEELQGRKKYREVRLCRSAKIKTWTELKKGKRGRREPCNLLNGIDFLLERGERANEG